MAHIKKCMVCQKEYDYCPRCKQYSHLPTWYLNFDSENCKNIEGIINQYEFGHIDESEAKKMLDKCDLKEVKNFRDDFKSIINKIKKSTKLVNKTAEIVNDNLVETEK